MLTPHITFSIPTGMPPVPVNGQGISAESEETRAQRRREFLIGMHEHMMPGDQLPPVEDKDASHE